MLLNWTATKSPVTFAATPVAPLVMPNHTDKLLINSLNFVILSVVFIYSEIHIFEFPQCFNVFFQFPSADFSA